MAKERSKKDKLKAAGNKMAFKLAEQSNDPDVAKLRKAQKIVKTLKTKLEKKYGRAGIKAVLTSASK